MAWKDYNQGLDYDNSAAAESSRAGRDIGPGCPGPGDLAARRAFERDFRGFCEHYFPNAFPLEWSEDHILVLDRMQEVVLNGGLFALAMPRGSGKTTISIRAAIWALLYGHRRFVCLVGATGDAAERILKDFKTELTYNEALVRDFRQVCYPLVRLENNARKCAGQLFDGQQTRIEWAADRLTFPVVPGRIHDGPDVAGSTVSVASITGAIRGQSTTLPNGTIIRPEMVILDDPQTRESAQSPSQNRQRTAIINGDVLGMAGPGRKIAAVMPCTVIREGDMADEILNRKKNPEWNGRKTMMVYRFPTNEALWERYREIRDESLQDERGGVEATEFYRANRAAMDEGSIVAWPQRHNEDEISALQHAMNLRFRDEGAFFAEYQNTPLPEAEVRADILTADQIAAKVNRIARGVVPAECSRLTAFIDVHATVLYYAVAAWDDEFGGSIVDYGTWPDQRRSYFTLRDAKVTMERATKVASPEAQIYAGLDALTDHVLGREWVRDDGTAMKVERCPIDANWGAQTTTVYKFCRQSKHAAILIPSHGKGIGASGRPMTDYAKRPGEQHGFNWYIPVESRGKRAIRKLIFDANFWKTFVHARLAVPMGGKTCLSLFGEKASTHRLFSEHLTAEYPIAVKREGSSRVVDEWKPSVGKPDNHWFDCLVGAAVAASMLGVSLPESGGARASGGSRVKYSEIQRQKREARRRA